MRTALIRPTAAAVAGLLALLVGLTVTASPSQAATLSSHNLGYGIHHTRYADGGFVGRYRVGKQKDFRIQPRKSAREAAYGQAHFTRHAAGASTGRSAQAAWILSTYGKTTDRTTAAAVDVAVYAKLHGHKWRVGTAYTQHRLRPTGHGKLIRSYATTILKQAAARRGPYTARLSATPVAAGNQTKVTVKVQNSKGLGPVVTSQQQGIAVVVSYPGQPSQTVYLNDAGVGVVYFTADAGSTTITATARRVPDSKMLVRKAYNPRASQIALAGHWHRQAFKGTGVGVTSQTVSENNAYGSVLVGKPLAGTYSVAGLSGSETVNFAVYGPFTSTSTSCSGTPLFTSATTVSADGTYPLPTYAAAKTGYYVWAVRAAGNAASLAASTCGTAYRTDKTTTTSQARYNSVASVSPGHTMGPLVSVGGFDRTETHTLTLRVYGPFADKTKVTCSNSNKLIRTVSSSVSNNTTDKRMTTAVSGTGYYVFQTTLANGTFMLGSRSSCGVVTRVQ